MSTITLTPKSIARHGYIVSPLFDHLIFIWPPVGFFALAWFIVVAGIADVSVTFGDPDSGGLYIALFPTFALTFTMAHVVAVIFRSHLNRQIFTCYPYRFVAVPIAFIVLFSISQTAWFIGLVLITWMDTWHSSQQTFGFGRLYDMRAGNDAEAGRRLDVCMAALIYIGPLLAGVSLATQLDDLSRLDEVGLETLARFPGWAVANQSWLTESILVLGVLFVGYYLYAYWRLAQNGYRVSTQKVLLYLALAVTSIYTWAFDSFGQSFLIMESFHSLQYFGLVWWAEGRQMQKTFRLASIEGGRGLSLAIFLGFCLSFGLWTSLFATTRFEFVLFSVVELMHYWYDGFIWSVRRKQVR